MTRQPFALHVNSQATHAADYPETLEPILSHTGMLKAKAEIGTWPGYEPTPLRALDALAREAGVAHLYYKDEAGRFGLGSFKALGGAYAVLRLLQKEVRTRTGGRSVTAEELIRGELRHITGEITVTCATDGNHGRSVAWGAQLFGCQCVIYIHQHVSEGRRAAIAAYGAEVIRVAGVYDDAVRRAAHDAEVNGWTVISDTSYEGYLDIPRTVMQGYTVMVDEALAQLPRERDPTHVFVQGGVGGLAAAVCAHLWETLGPKRPRFVVVEPDKAAALYLSARAGRRVNAEGDLDTVMACLAAGEVSLLAWEVLRLGTDAFMTLPDEAALDAMRRLARGAGGDPPVVAGESAVAGLAGLLAAAGDDEARRTLELGPDSVVLVIGSEGATDPDLYREIVGLGPEEVGAR